MANTHTTQFNESDTYVFLSPFGVEFTSKVHFEKGYWWTNEKSQYKVDSIRCLSV